MIDDRQAAFGDVWSVGHGLPFSVAPGCLRRTILERIQMPVATNASGGRVGATYRPHRVQTGGADRRRSGYASDPSLLQQVRKRRSADVFRALGAHPSAHGGNPEFKGCQSGFC